MWIPQATTPGQVPEGPKAIETLPFAPTCLTYQYMAWRQRTDTVLSDSNDDAAHDEELAKLVDDGPADSLPNLASRRGRQNRMDDRKPNRRGGSRIKLSRITTF